MNKPKLLIQNLTKTFFTKNQKIHILNNINLYLNNNEFVSIIGPSGCGKSTLFNIIAGIERETSGKIITDGEEIPPGYMLQKPLLLPWKTVEENIVLGLTIRHESDKIAKRKARELLEKFGLIDFAKLYPATLSGGMAQRIALLRTVLFNKNFLLMDEPFGALDTLTRLEMQMWLLDVWDEFQSSVLFVTHDVREAILLSDRIYVFSSRPAKILKEIHVHFPRPRKRELLSTKKAVYLEKELEDILFREQKGERK